MISYGHQLTNKEAFPVACYLYLFIYYYFVIICTLLGPHQPLAAPSNLLKSSVYICSVVKQTERG